MHDFNQPIMKYKLMIKIHYETGISYLCVTTKRNWRKYSGSGARWQNLLSARPSRILTILLYTDDDVTRFDGMCRYWSDHFDVVNNEDFANLVPEYGYEGNINNLVVYMKSLSPEAAAALYARRTASINAFYSTPEGYLAKDAARARSTERMSDPSARKQISDSMIAWYADPANEEACRLRNERISIANSKQEVREKISNASKRSWNTPSIPRAQV